MFIRATAGRGPFRGSARTLFLVLGVLLTNLGSLADAPLPEYGIRKVVDHYTLTSAGDVPPRDPKDWRLLASNDEGKTWKVLDIRKQELFSSRQQTRTFWLTNDEAF